MGAGASRQLCSNMLSVHVVQEMILTFPDRFPFYVTVKCVDVTKDADISIIQVQKYGYQIKTSLCISD